MLICCFALLFISWFVFQVISLRARFHFDLVLLCWWHWHFFLAMLCVCCWFLSVQDVLPQSWPGFAGFYFHTSVLWFSLQAPVGTHDAFSLNVSAVHPVCFHFRCWWYVEACNDRVTTVYWFILLVKESNWTWKAISPFSLHDLVSSF